MVKNLPADAGDTGPIPVSGKTPHAVEQLSLWATTTEACVLWSLCSATRDATAVRNPHTTAREHAPFSATRESPSAATKTQCSEKNTLKKFF